jgi:hypothetical protein
MTETLAKVFAGKFVQQLFGAQCSRAADYVARNTGKAARYVRSHTVQELLGEAGAAIRRNPAPALIGGVIVGVLLGRSLRR